MFVLDIYDVWRDRWIDRQPTTAAMNSEASKNAGKKSQCSKSLIFNANGLGFTITDIQT